MSGYGSLFAKIYNKNFIHFANRVAPELLKFYEQTTVAEENKNVLDLCCGTGQLASHFLERGYFVVGIDLSADMLALAKLNNQKYIREKKAKFVQADATNFALQERFGLVVSTFDALNHLENEAALKHCFLSVFSVLQEKGYFIFDLNTRLGLLQRWNGIQVIDRPDLMLINRSIVDLEKKKAYVRISGFLQNDEGAYQRFEEYLFNTIFELTLVKHLLLEIGWQEVSFVRQWDLFTVVSNPESEDRIFIIAKK